MRNQSGSNIRFELFTLFPTPCGEQQALHIYVLKFGVKVKHP